MLLVGGACAVFAFTGGHAAAAGEAITGRLVDDGQPVAGVEVAVADDGTAIGTARSDATGTFRVPVPGPGRYQVTLDVDTLPDGVALADPERRTLPRVDVQPGADKVVVFAFVPDTEPEPPTDAERFVALLLSGLRFGLVVAVAAVGLNLAYATTAIPNLAHGELITFGALVTWYANDAGLPLPLAGVIAVLAGLVLGRALDGALWRPLRRRGTDRITVMVITIGLALFLRHVYLLVFGGAQRPLADAAVQVPWRFGPVELLPKSAATIVVAVALLVATATFLTHTRRGTAVRATGDDADLARASGIDVDRTIRFTWMASAALAAAGGVLLAVTDAVQWDIGPRLILVVFAAVVVGGLGHVYGAMVGGLLIGIVSEVSSYWIAPDYKLLVALALLVLTLLIRPQGILGQRERVG
jgi:neutral amino acid transport system permease protein